MNGDLRTSDAAPYTTLIAVLIADRPSCLHCIARQGAMDVAAAAVAMTMIRNPGGIHRDAGRCRVCDAITAVFSIDPA